MQSHVFCLIYVMDMDAAQHHEQNLDKGFTLCTQLYSPCCVVKNP